MLVKKCELFDDMFNGILCHLTRQYGGNVVYSGVVGVRGSSVLNDCCEPINALVMDSCFVSDGDVNPWLCLDFKARKVVVSHYSIVSDRLKSWVLEGSHDGSDWDELDRRDDNDDLNGTSAANNGRWVTKNGTFTVYRRCEFRFIRLRQIGQSHNGSNRLVLYIIELFGWLLE